MQMVVKVRPRKTPEPVPELIMTVIRYVMSMLVGYAIEAMHRRIPSWGVLRVL